MRGFTVALFHALDSCHRVAMDGADVGNDWRELTPTRRELITVGEHEQAAIVDDQEVSIDAGRCTFQDCDGNQHTLQFWVERQLDDFDLIEM